MLTTRDRIVAEATRQLLEVGTEAFTVASVRDALRLSSGSMFHAFGSKPALVAEVYVRGMRSYQREAVAALTAHTDPARAIEAWIETHLRWVTENRDLADYLFSTQPAAVRDEAAGPLQEANEAFYAAAGDVFDRAAAAGLMAPLSLDVAHALTMGPTQEYCRRWTRAAALDPPTELTSTFTRAAQSALAASRKG